MPLFVISFVKPLITSCQICHFPKNPQLSTCHVLSSDLNIWPNSWWIFGTLNIFLAKFAFIAFRLSLLDGFITTVKFGKAFVYAIS